MSDKRDVAVIVGSLRKASLNRSMARELVKLAPKSLVLDIVDISEMPLYNQDLEENPPKAWTVFRNRIRKADAVLFVTPEYNRSMPGVLKNAVDVGSRPMAENVWGDRPAAVISVSPGAIGGFAANHHLRQSLVCLNTPTMPAPEFYVGGAGDLFDGEGKLKNDKTKDLASKFLSAFATWIDRNAKTQE